MRRPVQPSASEGPLGGVSATASSLDAPYRVLTRIAGVLLAILFVGAAAQMAVPIPGTPVPVTLQDLAVLVVGVVLGPRVGVAAMIAYLGAGALGAPVFSNGHAGLAWLIGPTGGYLLAYPAAAWVMGTASGRPRRTLTVLTGAVLAQGVIFGSGLGQLILLTGQNVEAAVALGVVPFLPGAVIKTALAVAFVWALDRFGPESFSGRSGQGRPEQG
ncbi:MAG: biotin transporter BioY [Gemmatimonadota bacterium]